MVDMRLGKVAGADRQLAIDRQGQWLVDADGVVLPNVSGADPVIRSSATSSAS
jgi:hypothetical protein